ncbi:MAG: response regulator [Desulfococcaceae bacterium]
MDHTSQRYSADPDSGATLFQPSPLPDPFRVLLVEDNEHDRAAFGRALNRSDVKFYIESYERGEAAAERILNDASDFHIVVIDYNLPGMNGLQVFNYLCREAAETLLPPFMMLTGAGNEELAVRAIKAGFYDYLVKDPDDRYFTLLPTLLSAVYSRYENYKAFLMAQQQLAHSHQLLEDTVAERTRELKQTVGVLQGEVSERRQAEKALWASRQRLRELAARAMESQENERKAIAQELHDGVAASLTGIKMGLEIRIHQMGDPPVKKGLTLEEIVDRLKSIISEVSQISARLRPESLDSVGLLGLMRNTLVALENQYPDVRIHFSPQVEEEEIPEPLKVVFYRITQEAANNALRHGNPSRVDVTLRREDDHLALVVADNGEGFDVNDVVYSPGPGGYGLKSMRDRAEINRGAFEISSTPGAGARIRAAFDLRDFPSENS